MKIQKFLDNMMKATNKHLLTVSIVYVFDLLPIVFVGNCFFFFLKFFLGSNLNCSSSSHTSHDLTFLNNTNPTTTTTVLPDFQYLTSPSDDQPLATTSHIPVYPLPKSVDVNQYGNNITKNSTHVKKSLLSDHQRTSLSIVGHPTIAYPNEQFCKSTTNDKYWSYHDWLEKTFNV